MSIQIGAKRKFHDPDILEVAVSMVKGKTMSLRMASKTYGIPKSTLSDKVNNKTSMTPPHKTVLTPAEEKKLVTWVIDMGKIGFGRTKQDLLAKVK